VHELHDHADTERQADGRQHCREPGKEQQRLDVAEQQRHRDEDARAVAVGVELGRRTGRPRQVSRRHLRHRHAHLQRMHRRLGLDFEALRLRRERLHEPTREHAIPGQHVRRLVAEEHAEQRVQHAVAEGVPPAVRCRVVVLAHRRHHVEAVVDEPCDEVGRARRVVGGVAVDEDVDVGLHLGEHASHHATLARSLLAAHDRAGGARDHPGVVTGAVVVDVDRRLGQRGTEVGDDAPHRDRFVAAGHQHRDARRSRGCGRRRQPVDAGRRRSACHAETAKPEIE